VHPRTYSSEKGAASTASFTAAGSGAAFRVMGYNVPWSAILGVALVSGMGAYAYESKKVADVDRKKNNFNAFAAIFFPFVSSQTRMLFIIKYYKCLSIPKVYLKSYYAGRPLEAEVMKFPPLPEGVLLTSQTGQKIDIAQAVRGKHGLLAFGALHSTDKPLLESMARATDSAKKRTGIDIIPVYISLDPVHDKPEDLKIAAGRSGSPSMLVVTGAADSLLEAAERFKNVGTAREQAEKRGTELQKKLGPASMASTYTSDYYYLIDQASRIIGMMPKTLRTEEVAEKLAQDMHRSKVDIIP